MRKDFLIGEDGDLQIKDGDFVVGASDDQHVRQIIMLEKGHNRQFPLLGVGIRRELNGVPSNTIKRAVALNLEADGYKVREVVFNETGLTVDYEASYS